MGKNVTLLQCPRCRSTKIEVYAGMLTGSYSCGNCGYLGPIVLEKVTRNIRSTTQR